MNATNFYYNWRQDRVEKIINKFDFFLFFMVSFILLFHFILFHVSLITLPDLISYININDNYFYFFIFDVLNITLTVFLFIFRKKIIQFVYYQYGKKNIPRKIIPDLKKNFDPDMVDTIFSDKKVNIKKIEMLK